MEDLREVGKKVIDAIKSRKPADAGDLAIGIGEIIEQIRQEQESDKLDHLEGLFRELVYGEAYELRQKRVEEDSTKQTQTFGMGGVQAMSGVMHVNPGAISGWQMHIPPVMNSVPNAPQQLGNQQNFNPTPPPPFNPAPPLFDNPLDAPPAPPKKPFKKRWWMTTPKKTEEVEETQDE